MKKNRFIISFAGIRIRFILPDEREVPLAFHNFVEEARDDSNYSIDAEYKVILISEPLRLPKQPRAVHYSLEIYDYQGKQLRLYRPLVEKNGCQVACLLSDDGSNILYYPAAKWDYYASDWQVLHLLGIETVLLRKNAFLLHSSVIKIHDQTVLFSGPSEIGKSTQAANWEKYLDVDVLNGDRCVIRKSGNDYYGCGSPWSGTSKIYRDEQAIMKGIFILRKSDKNAVRKLGIEGFKSLFQQCIVNSWDSEYLEKLTDLLTGLMEKIPVYELSCRPDKEAVMMAYDTLFKED